MKNIKDELLKVKPWLIVISFAALMVFIVINFGAIINILGIVFSNLNVLFYGLVMAFVMNIPMVKIENAILNNTSDESIIRKFKRGISITLSAILFIAVITMLIMFILPELSESIIRLINNLANYFNSLIGNINQFLDYLHVDTENLNNVKLENLLNSLGLDYASIIQNASSALIGGTGDILSKQIGYVGNLLFDIFMGFVVSMYLLGSKENLIRQFKKVIVAIFSHDIASYILRICRVSNDIFKDFVGGKLIEVIIVGLMVYVSMIIFKLPFALLISCLCAIMTIIPVVGSLIATIIACLLLASDNIFYALGFFVIYQIVQNLDGNLIYPKIIGKSLGLPALWILVSVLFFGGLFGAVGMLIAVPFTACIYTFFTDFINYRLKVKKKNGEIDESLL
ncbi:MAG: AI-2E family transporter [Firmicutes bacterium]|nr:AI-2E family transporter [Bacillota bacterium]MDY3091559.1 AI-2E family transporter [Erysipelotrichaceae bacterium]